MGIDWNGKGTGTRIVVTQYDPATRKRRVVHHEAIDDDKATTKKSFNRIVELNKLWHCDYVYVDAGFGFVQDELIKDIGVQAGTFDSDTAKLKYINVVDFGAKLETNALVPNRNPDSKYLPNPKDDILKRRTKPFMVEGVVMAFEMELVEVSREYALLEEQLRGFRVKTWTKGGAADTYSTDADSGDHDLDAFMLSMLGIELNYGLWHTKETVRRLVQIAHVSGWGLPSTVISQQAASPVQTPEPAAGGQTERMRELKRDTSGVPARTKPESNLQEQYRLLHMARQSYTVAPVNSPGGPPAMVAFLPAPASFRIHPGPDLAVPVVVLVVVNGQRQIPRTTSRRVWRPVTTCRSRSRSLRSWPSSRSSSSWAITAS